MTVGSALLGYRLALQLNHSILHLVPENDVEFALVTLVVLLSIGTALAGFDSPPTHLAVGGFVVGFVAFGAFDHPIDAGPRNPVRHGLLVTGGLTLAYTLVYSVVPGKLTEIVRKRIGRS